MSCLPVALQTQLLPSKDMLVAAVVMSNFTSGDIEVLERTCSLNVLFEGECWTFLNQSMFLAKTYLTAVLEETVDASKEAYKDVAELDIKFAQFGQESYLDEPQFYAVRVLDNTMPDFHVFGWMFLLEWALGRRDVVTFMGDTSSITILTEHMRQVAHEVNQSEMPTNFALYMRNIVLYVTFCMFSLSVLILIYFFLCHGHVELLNLFQVQRVGAVVWVGRPLLFMRSLTAVGLLSTCNLQLIFNGKETRFQVVQNPWFKTLLAANEVTWMVTIVNDIAMAITQDYTPKYAGWDSAIVWLASATLSFTSPVLHTVRLEKFCAVAQFDYEVVCSSGVVTIGQMYRLLWLAGIVLGSNLLCYLIARAVIPPRQLQVTSIFLYGGAAHLFNKTRWIAHDVYYMDRMSAVMNGVLTLRVGEMIYGLDVKLWHTFETELPSDGDVVAIGKKNRNHVIPIGLMLTFDNMIETFRDDVLSTK